MGVFTILGIAVGLSLDAVAVAITIGAMLRPLKLSNALTISLAFGVFQAIMPIVGWGAGRIFERYIEACDHWIAFALLSLIGIRMIYNSFFNEPDRTKDNFLRPDIILILALATSVDALAVGVSFAFLGQDIIAPILTIGVVTFLLSLGGVYAGNRLGSLCEKRIEAAGGVILIIIGVKILWEHIGAAVC